MEDNLQIFGQCVAQALIRNSFRCLYGVCAVSGVRPNFELLKNKNLETSPTLATHQLHPVRPIDASVAETHSLLWIQGKKPALNNVSTVSQYKLYSCDSQQDCYITNVQKCSAVKLYRSSQLYVYFIRK